MGPPFSRLTSLSFHVNRASHSWVTTFSKFDLENQGSRSWVRSQFKDTMCVLHPIDSHSFCSMSIGYPVPELRLFQNLTSKIKGQGHGWGHSSKSQCESNILSKHIPFVPSQSGIPFLSYDVFKTWPWKSKVKVMGEVTVQSHNMGPPFSRLTSLSFHVNRASHSWVTTFSKFDLENQGSRSWVRSQFKVTMCVLHPIDSHPFCSMSIGYPIPELRLFQNLTSKIKGQDHGWGHSSKSQCESNILSTHIPFVPSQSGIPFLSYDVFKTWPWKSKVKVMGEVTVQSHNVSLTSYRLTFLLFQVNQASHSWVPMFSKFDLENQGSRSWVRSQFKVTMCVLHPIDSHPFCSMSIRYPVPELRLFQNLTLKIKGQGHGWGHSSKSQCESNILSTHIPFIPSQSGIPFLSYDVFKTWPWKSKVKVMGEVTVQSHNMGPPFSRLTSLSFHVNRASHSWVTTFSKFDLENQGSRSWWGHTSKSQCVSYILLTHIPFVQCQSGIPFLSYDFFKIWPWKSRVKVMGEVTVQSHNESLTS